MGCCYTTTSKQNLPPATRASQHHHQHANASLSRSSSEEDRLSISEMPFNDEHLNGLGLKGGRPRAWKVRQKGKILHYYLDVPITNEIYIRFYRNSVNVFFNEILIYSDLSNHSTIGIAKAVKNHIARIEDLISKPLCLRDTPRSSVTCEADTIDKELMLKGASDTITEYYQHQPFHERLSETQKFVDELQSFKSLETSFLRDSRSNVRDFVEDDDTPPQQQSLREAEIAKHCGDVS
jgi:hypothetical protein